MSALPNIVLMHSHDLGRYLGCYGYDVETPNVDAIAEHGVKFDEHYVTAPQCSPSRGSLMTGNHPHVNGLMGLAHGAWELHLDQTTLPEYLSRAGYDTHLFGLQHVTHEPERLGYDVIHSKGVLSSDVSPAIHEVDRARDVASVFERFVRERETADPFFASLGFFELHRMEGEDGLFGFEDDRYDADDPDDVEPLPFLPDREGIREDLAAMRGMVYAVDEAVGTIADALEAAEINEETLLLFTTEHGLAFPRAKGCCYDSGIGGALLLQYPDRIEGGRTCDELVSNVDILPTLLEYAGQVAPNDVAGRSFRPLLEGEPYRPRERIFAEMTWHDMYNPVRAIRTDRYKYVRNFWHLPKVYLTKDIYRSEAGREVREELGVPTRAYEELYDLEEDPHERSNLVDDPDYEPVRRRLQDELFGWMSTTDDPLLEGPVPPADYEAMISDARIGE